MLTATNPQTAPSLSAQSDRFYALDAVRAFALIIGIFFHGVESFVSYVLGSIWATHDSQHSVSLDAFFYVAHVFRMQAFFVIAGYFAHLLYHRKGANGFLQNRTRRILIPLVLFWPILYTSTWLLWSWGSYQAGPSVSQLSYWDKVAQNLPSFISFKDSFLAFLHLWFLYYLALFCGGVLLLRPVVARFDSFGSLRYGVDKVLAYLMRKWWGGLTLSLLIILPMSGMKGWFGVDTPNQGLVPMWAPFVLYGLFFSLGWLLNRQPGILDGFRKYWRQNLLISGLLIAGLTVFFLNLVYSIASASQTHHVQAPDPATTASILLILNSVYAFASMTAVFAFIGFILTYFDKPSPRIRYLSDASYWLYLIHLPVVIFFQILVAPLQIHWLLKMSLIFVPSFAILFLTYHYGVRNTWLGVLLNGRRYPLK